MMWNGYGWGGGGWLLMGLMMFVFWGLVVAAVIWAVRAGAAHPSPPAAFPAREARRILDERFAHGEIGEDEYRQRRGVLDAP